MCTKQNVWTENHQTHRTTCSTEACKSWKRAEFQTNLFVLLEGCELNSCIKENSDHLYAIALEQPLYPFLDHDFSECAPDTWKRVQCWWPSVQQLYQPAQSTQALIVTHFFSQLYWAFLWEVALIFFAEKSLLKAKFNRKQS